MTYDVAARTARIDPSPMAKKPTRTRTTIDRISLAA
jgi:hypothetical protein